MTTQTINRNGISMQAGDIVSFTYHDTPRIVEITAVGNGPNGDYIRGINRHAQATRTESTYSVNKMGEWDWRSEMGMK